MGDEDDWKSLPIEDKIAHKVWKARLAGYEEAAKRFKLIDSDKSPEYNNFLGNIKKFVTETNAAAQEKGLEATLQFVQNAACATKCCNDVISGIVAKVMTARPKSKQLGVDICLMYIEIEKQDVVMEELVTGFAQKNPKVIAACINASIQCLQAFGGKVVMMKGLVKQMPSLLSHSDKNVRAEAKQLSIEIYKWIRDAIKPQLQNIKPVQLKELEEEWAKLDATPPAPTRFTRTEQAKQAVAPPPVASQDNCDGGAMSAPAQAAVAIDPWDMFDPVDILSHLAKDFYEQVESKKWQERKEALEGLEKLTSTPRIEPGQYGEICAMLKKIITKDSNIMVVALAGKCVTGLAKGLRKKFQTYSGLLVPAILGKFKEKKLNVVVSLRDAIDAVFATTNFTNIMEDLLASLDNKNPQIKEETCRFLTRTFQTNPPAVLPKASLKLIVPAVLKKLDDTFGPVRDAAAECLGTGMKLVGERAMAAYIDELDKIKQEKVKEFFEKAEINGGAGRAPPAKAAAPPTTTSAPPPAKPPAALSAPAKGPPKGPPKDGAAKKAPPKKAGPKKVASGAKKPAAGGKPKKAKKKATFEDDLKELTEPELPDGVVEADAEDLFGEALLTQFSSANWKERLAAVEEMTTKIEGMEGKAIKSQVIVRTLGRKPGWKDSNFQVMNGKFKLLAIVAKKSEFTRRSALFAISALISKIGDIKLKAQVKETLKVFAENISLNYISLKISGEAETAKNPKLQAESLIWMSEAIHEFGFRIDLKPHIAFIKKLLANTNPTVRKACIEFIGTLHKYVGANIRVFFEEEKAALLAQIDEEFAKVKDQPAPAPTRKFVDDEEEEEEEAGGGEEGQEEGGATPAINMEDMVDRTNISDKISEAVIAKIMDKNWKIRKEGLEEVQGFISEAKFITPDIGELAGSIKARLADNNKVLVQMTINICKQLAESGGSGMVKYKGTVLPALIGPFADAKPNIRKLAEEALDAWHEKVGFLPLLDGEILSTALKSTNPNLKATLLLWLEKKLPNEKKLPADLKECLAPLYACLEDRSADVRKAAQAAVPMFMAHIGYDAMNKATASLKPPSNTTVQGILEKAQEVCKPIAAPGKKGKAKPSSGGAGSQQAALSSQIAAAAVSTASGGGGGSGGGGEKKEASKKKEKAGEKKKTATKAPTSRKKDVVEDDGPPIIHKTGKAQRIKDEKALKVLKWNFTTPREEIVEQLKEQMLSCFSPSMHAKLFNKDFKLHIEAIGILTQCVSKYPEAVLESMDLILKWVSLRFFDTNTSVLLKALELLTALFKYLEANEKKLANFEGSAFIPYLIGKIGDPKDNVRKSVRELCKQITTIFPATQMFVYLLQGLESKNSKSRMECCEELGSLINKFGMSVCQPNPKILKEVATQIADRDNGVRSAALNCIVEAYNLVGDQVYKFIGRLADKEMGYLEERIKRAGNKKEASPPAAAATKQAVLKPRQAGGAKTIKDINRADILAIAKKELAEEGGIAAPKPASAPNIKREFELDFNAIEGNEDVITGSIPQLKKVDIDDIAEAASIPDNLLKAYSDSSKVATKQSSIKDVGELLDLTIAKISSSDAQAAMESLVQLEDVFKKKKTDPEIVKRIDQYLVTSLVQLKMLFSRQTVTSQSEDNERLLKLILSGMLSLFEAECYAKHVSYNVLKDLIINYITVLNDKSLMNFAQPDLSIQCVNRLLLKVLSNSDKTSCLRSCIYLLQELCEKENTSPSLVKLVMKCVWKLTHLLPDFINEVRLPELLQAIHVFYTVLPASMWRRREDRVPQQTVKALLQTLVKLRAQELYNCLETLENKNASEVPLFIAKHCKGKTQQSGQTRPATAPTLSVKKFSQPSNEVLVKIFKKIGSKENYSEGVLELHYFKQQFPDYDVNPFIKNTSLFFQNFIDRSLKTIAAEEKNEINTKTENTTTATRTLNAHSGSESEMYMDRLRKLKENFKKKSSSSLPPSEEEQQPKKTETKDIEEESIQVEVAKTEPTSKKNLDLDDIKKRLAMMKTGN